MKKTFTCLFLLLSVLVIAQPSGWVYNQTVTITNPNTVNAVDYQLRMTINTQSLIAAGRLNANGSDLRFGPNCTSTSFYNYWIEGGINTTTTVVWVKVPFIAASSSTVMHMFYGNPSASPVSTIPGTFRGPNSATDSISGGTINNAPGANQRGFRFAPYQNLLVTDFGKIEPNGTSRYVTIFNYTSQAIVSQTQVPGPSATYSYAPIASPVWLNAGSQYVLQMYGNSSEGYYYQTSSQIGQHLQYFEMQYSNGGTQNTFPTTTLANYHYGYGDFWYYICSTLAITPTYTLNDAPISIIGPTVPLCNGATVSLSTTATGTYSWSTGATAPSIVVTATGNTTYSVTQPNASGCNAIALITFTVNNAPPVVTVTQNTTTICPTNTVLFTASGALSYTWTGGITNGVPFSPLTTSVYMVTGANGCGTSSASAGITVTPLPVFAIVSPTLICAGGTATLQAAGAQNYTWSPGNYTNATTVVSASAPTIYTVVGTNASCAGITTVALAVDPVPTISPSGNSFTICEGNSMTLTANGALTYTWMPGNLTGSSVPVSPTISTAYNVVGTNAFNCESSASQIVLVNPAPPVTLSSNRTQLCLGASATLIASGAQSYAWSPVGSGTTVVITPNITQTYSVTGTNTLTGCSLTRTLSIPVFTLPLTVSPASICPGETITLNASGANTYSWVNGPGTSFFAVSPSVTTVYTITAITVTAAMNCPISETVQVTVLPEPVLNAGTNKAQVCRNEVATFTVGGAQTYTWSNLNSNPTFTLRATSLSGYTFYVTGTGANGCSSMATAVLKVIACTGLEEQVAGKNVHVFPNPSAGEIKVYSHTNTLAALVNEAGQHIRDLNLKEGQENKFDLGDLSPGVYFIVNEAAGIRESVVVIKK